MSIVETMDTFRNGIDDVYWEMVETKDRGLR